VVPLLSTVAPAGGDAFFERLLGVRRGYGPDFGLQVSLHTTDEAARRRVVPVKTWPFTRVAAYGARFHQPGARKVHLAFAPTPALPLDAAALRAAGFDPAHFAVRLTPLTPTAAAAQLGWQGRVDAEWPEATDALVHAFAAQGYEVEVAAHQAHALEASAGAACGQYLGGGREGPVRPRRTLSAGRCATSSRAP